MIWLTKIGQIIAAYSLLYYRPEFFILVSKAMGKSAFETFSIVWCWTTFLTALTYWALDLIKIILNLFQKIFRKFFKKSQTETPKIKSSFYANWFIAIWFQSLDQKFKNLSNKTVKKLISCSPYLLFLTFIFPIIPSLDTASVIAARLLKIRFAFWLFILINTIKFLVITAFCYGWFKQKPV